MKLEQRNQDLIGRYESGHSTGCCRVRFGISKQRVDEILRLYGIELTGHRCDCQLTVRPISRPVQLVTISQRETFVSSFELAVRYSELADQHDRTFAIPARAWWNLAVYKSTRLGFRNLARYCRIQAGRYHPQVEESVP